MTDIYIWSSAAIIYLIFWVWYVGFGQKINPAEIDAMISEIRSKGSPSDKTVADLRRFFEQDDGNDFVMVNLLELKQPVSESRQKLEKYSKAFLRALFKRAGHPIFIARMGGEKVENLGCDQDNWRAVGMIRYRSRRDLMEILPETFGSDNHNLKLEALQRTAAYPSSNWTIAGGPKLVVFLLVSLLAALVHIATLMSPG